jgi:hypothetical protein
MTDTFKKIMRMSYADFTKLVDLLKPQLMVDDERALRATPRGALIPEQRLAMTLNFLGGDRIPALIDRYGVGVSTAYKIVWHTLGVINSCEALRTKFDVSAEVPFSHFRVRLFRGLSHVFAWSVVALHCPGVSSTGDRVRGEKQIVRCICCGRWCH